MVGEFSNVGKISERFSCHQSEMIDKIFFVIIERGKPSWVELNVNLSQIENKVSSIYLL